MKDKNEIKNRIDELRRLIAKYDYNYYVLDSPLVEDYEYDNLYKELKILEDVNPEFDSQDSPTKRVSEQNIGGFEKFTHSPRMYSLDNTYNDNELESFHKRITNELHTGFSYSIEPKIDGAAISIIYRDSLFFRALTRGDGETGDNATENIRTIRDLPLMLKKKITGDITVRGE
ncbi:TPA: DNA ligase, partial [candidate division WOR-3 bacterium]|nr:DNA ligase [candidate division WOR-3 bacterium]